MAENNGFLPALLAPVARIAISALSRSRLPQVQGQLKLAGLDAPVQVLRDRWYVPHIFAQTSRDAIFAQGLVHAQERLWQMDINRRIIAGRLSEVLGEAALLPDRVMRTLGFKRIVEQETALLPEDVRDLAEAYCRGVNAGIDLAVKHHKLPVEFSLLGYQPEPWTVPDILGFSKLMAWILAGNWEAEFMRQQMIDQIGPEKTADLELNLENSWAVILDAAPPGLDPTKAFTGAHASEGAGSNNWVIHGQRTASGHPLLANDMHLELTAPAIWFENHLSGGDLALSGVTLPGTFLITAGHNRDVAWGYTDGVNDVQDLYIEHLRDTADGGVEYEYQGEWLPAEVRHEVIHVKGKKTVDEKVVVTRHGPIINLLVANDFPDAPPLAMRWTALEPESTVQALYKMAQARDCAEFYQALALFSGPGQNTVYADTKGNIGYTLTGRTPLRAKGNGMVPSPGWTGEYEWTGYIPFEKMPHLENPAKGYVATANNPHSREAGAPFISNDYFQVDRAARIVELIEQRKKLDVAYIQRMQYDTVSVSARVLAYYLGQLAVEDTDLRQITQAFSTWDANLTRASSLATVYQITIHKAVNLLLDKHLGAMGKRAQGNGVASLMWSNHVWEWFIHLLETPESPWFDLGGGEQRDDILRLALRQAVDALKQQHGEDQQRWHWGDVHQLTFKHLLGTQKALEAAFNRGPFPIGGDPSTIACSFGNLFDDAAQPTAGPPFRFIADLGDLDHCLGMLVPGQSGHPASPHYQDGIPGWLEGGYHPMLVQREEVEANLSARLDIQPV